MATEYMLGLVVAVQFVALVATSTRYGYHRDELYFRLLGQHLAWGYVDQPPLTPLLSAASVALLGVSPTAVLVVKLVEPAKMAVIAPMTATTAIASGASRKRTLQRVTM